MEFNNKPPKEYVEQLESLFVVELSSLHRYACYRLGSQEVAEDVIQELYLKLRTTHREGIHNMRYYIYRSLMNACAQRLRDRRKLSFVDLTSLKDLREDDLQAKDFEQEYQLIGRLLETIPQEQSEVIRLHLHGECTFAEIADILEAPLATVKSRYRYGIEHLRQELQKQNLL
jgi:RNA polymerase sigma-70 factor (ECF subfamily)